MSTIGRLGRIVKRPLSLLRGHVKTIFKEILFEDLNRGHKARLFFAYLKWHLMHKYFGRKWIISFDNGLRSIVYPYPDHDAGEVNIWTRNVDWHDIELVRSILKPGDFVVDAGCNVGNRTLALADLIDGALLIDAGNRAAERTRENLLLNKLPLERFVVVQKAVADRLGSVRFTALGGASTINRVVNDVEEAGAETVEVELTTIDHELLRLGKTPAFIKVDVEGQDLPTLRGSIKALTSGTVRLVKFEHNQSEPLEPLVDFFDGIGWRVFALNRDGKITFDDDVVSKNMNLFAAHDKKIQEMVSAQV